MPLTFGNAVPRKYYNAARKWWRRLLCDEWSVKVEYCSHTEFGRTRKKKTLAQAHLLSDYNNGGIFLSDEISNLTDDEAEAVILHELRHCHYAALYDTVLRVLDLRRKLSKAEATEMVTVELERCIERDLLLLLRAYKGR